MNKSGVLLTSAVLTLGIATGAMAADAPRTAAPMSADAPAAAMTVADAPKKTKKHSKKKSKKAAPATT
jgi:hypothetical protein